MGDTASSSSQVLSPGHSRDRDRPYSRRVQLPVTRFRLFARAELESKMQEARKTTNALEYFYDAVKPKMNYKDEKDKFLENHGLTDIYNQAETCLQPPAPSSSKAS